MRGKCRKPRRINTSGGGAQGPRRSAEMASASLAAKCRGVAVGLLLFQTALLSSGAVLFPSLPLLLVPAASTRRTFRTICQGLQEAWLAFACALLRFGLGVQVFVYVPSDLRGLEGLRYDVAVQDAVLISNHRTRIDWMFLWGLCLATKRLASLKIVLKDSLKKVPGFGWAMQCFGFAFLSRSRREGDLELLREVAAHHCQEPGPGLTYLLFPEGTDLSESNVQKSHEFSKSKGLPEFNEVLHPKTAGFVAAMEAVEAASVYPTKLLDVTIAYVERQHGQRPNEKLLFTGCPPREVHLRLECPRLPGAAVKGEARRAAYAELCRKLFQAKEERLARFSAPVRQGGFPDVAALAEGCEVTALAAARGSAFSMGAATVLFAMMEGVSFCAAVKHWRVALAWTAAGVLAFGAATHFGGVDAWERWHARRYPAPGRGK